MPGGPPAARRDRHRGARAGDPHVGLIIDPPNLGRSFHDTPLAGLVADALGLPTFLDRDTQVAALGEGRFGRPGCADYLYLTVSTGIGGTVVTGAPDAGPDGTAGELGHSCGSQRTDVRVRRAGHLEAIASGSGIARAARVAAEHGRSPALAALIRERGDAFGGRDVAAAEAGDAEAARIMADAHDAFALACSRWRMSSSRPSGGRSVAAGQGDGSGFGARRGRRAGVPPSRGPRTDRPRAAQRRRRPRRWPRAGCERLAFRLTRRYASGRGGDHSLVVITVDRSEEVPCRSSS